MSVVRNKDGNMQENKKRLQKFIPSGGSRLLLVLMLWREISPKYLIFPFRHLSELLPCNEPPDSQCVNHPGNESNTPCYEEEWEDRWKCTVEVQIFDMILGCFSNKTCKGLPVTYLRRTCGAHGFPPISPSPLIARANGDYLPPQAHTCPYERGEKDVRSRDVLIASSDLNPVVCLFLYWFNHRLHTPLIKDLI